MRARPRFHVFVLGLTLFISGMSCAHAQERDYAFDGSISREVLENYLSRSMTNMDLLMGRGNFDDNLRMIQNTGVKFAGRAIYRWGGETALPNLLKSGKLAARNVHAMDPDIILQAGEFEIVTTQVNQLKIPAKVFELFGLEPEERNFRYDDMIYPDGHRVNHWNKGASVPDMSCLETRMWFVYLAVCYIDIGCEAIHFGQVEIMDDRDPDHVHWREMMRIARAYAKKNARRHMLICDAHVPSGGIVHDGELMFDVHSFPLRMKNVAGEPQHAVLEVGYMDTIYKRSKGGMTPSGWECESLPYIVEVDNYGRTNHEGEIFGKYWCWGYDEMSWFAHQPKDYRNEWLRYAWDWIRETDPNGFLQMPGSRVLHSPVDERHWYFANTPSAATPDGFDQEETIKAIWTVDK